MSRHEIHDRTPIRVQEHQVTDVHADRPARRDFRIQTQRRGGYDGAVMHDVQLVVSATGAMVWAQTFTDEDQAEEFLDTIESHLDSLEADEFRSRYSVPSSM